MPKFFDDLKDKAQSAISATPLAQYVPGREQGSGSPPPQGGSRSHALGALQHQFRTLQVQYGSGSKDLRQLQLIITGQKGVVLDLEKEAQDSKAVSKEFYIWGQAEDSDVKDVTDRLAYLTYVQGSLAAGLASSLDASRAPLKALRDAEAHLQPKRNIRLNYDLQISRLKNEGKPGTEQKLRELETLLKKAEQEDEPLEKEVELLKRKAIVESETQKWHAIREYGEKLVLLSQACSPLVEALPSVPPTTANPYKGAASTAATRATLQKALDNYKPGNFTLPTPSGSDSETRSFGETHASELSRISSVASHHDQKSQSTSPPLSPPGHGLPPQPTAHAPEPIHTRTSGTSVSSGSAGSTPVNPLALNNTPAPIPSVSPEPIPETTSTEPQSSVSPTGSIPTSMPTVAETGVPLAAGNKGPGPASGSLAGGRRGSQGSSTTGDHSGPGYGEAAPSYGSPEAVKYGLNDAGAPARYESAEDEKKRLEREDRERVLRGNAPPSSYHAPGSSTQESAEEEKKRLEREERERVLRAGGTQGGPPGPNSPDPEDGGDGNTPPPYVEPR